ncbi:MAG TPA: hypothetical protein ENK19_01835 [Acidobacteria bacterium]|nr:hypothetical protein [Acidobacteriota bacterium]
MSKCVLIGVDSATFDIIEPMAARGELPNFRRIMENGAWGRLNSTVPPVTPPAWTSMVTGMNPGKHGIFDFYATPSHGYDRQVVGSGAVRAATLWGLLSERGRTAGAINVPMTHPPREVNGFIIPGMQYALDSREGFAYPQGLIEEIETAIGATYEVMHGDERAHFFDVWEDYARRWREITEVRTEAILYLMDRHPVDFFMPVYYSIDAIQHLFWRHYDPDHPHHDPKLARKYGDVIPDFYRLCDANIGRIMERCDDETTVLIASDHGAGPQHKAFYLNRWLMDRGLLVVKEKYRWLLRLPSHILFKVLRRMGSPAINWTVPIKAWPLLRRRVDPREGLRLAEIIDWGRTRAFAANYTEQGIYINLRGREPRGIVEPGAEYERLRAEIADMVREIRDPDTGEALVEQVVPREEVYHGPYAGEAADLFLVMKGGTYLIQGGLLGKLVMETTRISGTHRSEGIFLAHGPGIAAGRKVENPDITDIAATVLYAMEEPIPEDMDGRVIEAAYDPAALAARPPAPAGASAVEAGGGDGTYDEEDAAKIEDALRKLGYMG